MTPELEAISQFGLIKSWTIILIGMGLGFIAVFCLYRGGSLPNNGGKGPCAGPWLGWGIVFTLVFIIYLGALFNYYPQTWLMYTNPEGYKYLLQSGQLN